jgi:para-nitrobenzyl esterase
MKSLFFSSLFMVIFSVNSSAQVICGENIAVVNTDAGKVRGYIRNHIYTYKGIPYGEANRFEPAQKPKPWTGIRSSMSYGPVAPVPDYAMEVQDESEFVFHYDWGNQNEDCLRLNIWSPGIADGKKRPVLFWIFGGGYTSGSSQEMPSYDGESLAKTGDVVVVSINHRLNALGFLDLSAYGEKYKHSANLGILDIRTALEWVKSNIENFGGDPGNVTIFGQSGGGAKINTLMSMPSVKGLFHKAINESGAYSLNIPDKETSQAIAAAVLNELHLEPSQADSLQRIPFATLVEAGKNALRSVETKMNAAGKTFPPLGLRWGPSIDGEDIPYQPLSKESLEVSKDVPLMIGTVKNEFTSFIYGGLNKAPLAKITEVIKQQQGAKADAYIAAVKKAWPKDTLPSDLIDVDVIFRPGAVEQANAKSAVPGGAPVYMYLFTWQSPVMDGKYKAVHTMEIPFVFNNIQRCEEITGGNKDAYTLADKVSKAWINFARNGNPNHKGLPQWPAYNSANTATMHFDNSCEVMPQMDKELFDLVKSK